MNSIKLISLNICNDDDLIYGSDELNKTDINKFIKYHNITDPKLINDINQLFKCKLKSKLDNNIYVIDDNFTINYLHKSIVSYYIHENKLRSIQINLENKIRYINNYDPEVVDKFMSEKKKLLIDSILESESDFILLQELDAHYMFNNSDMNVLVNYEIISPLNATQSFKKMMLGMLNNYIIYKKSPTTVLINSELKEYGTIGEFDINETKIKIVSGRWYPLKNHSSLRLKQLEMLDAECGKIIFMGDTNLRYNETIKTNNVSDSIVDNNFTRYYTINKNVNKYFNEDLKYIARYDRIYSSGVDIIYGDLCFNTSHQKLKNIYRSSGFISDHFGLVAEFFIN
jgi:hypothetical protein